MINLGSPISEAEEPWEERIDRGGLPEKNHSKFLSTNERHFQIEMISGMPSSTDKKTLTML